MDKVLEVLGSSLLNACYHNVFPVAYFELSSSFLVSSVLLETLLLQNEAFLSKLPVLFHFFSNPIACSPGLGGSEMTCLISVCFPWLAHKVVPAFFRGFV